MRKIERLRQEALESCTWRGHKMHNFQHGVSFIKGSQNGLSLCTNPGCSAWVVIDANPEANGIEIGGTAVALHCPAEA